MLLLSIIVAAIVGLAAISGLILMTFGPYVLAYLLGRKVRSAAAQKDSEGRPVQMTGLANAGLGTLPLDVGFVAGLGRDAVPQSTAGSLVLRPTWGVRMLSIVFSALLIYIVYIGRGDLVPDSPYVWPVLGLVLGYGILTTNIYELRYSTEGFVTSGFARRRKEVRWKDLSYITDNGHYFYYFHTFSGQKVETLKYLVGIGDFLSYARAQMHFHDRH